MKLSPAQREQIRMMFGGKCAYCGIVLDGKWHVDHVESVRRECEFVPGQVTKQGYSKTRFTGRLSAPHNDRFDNLYPACVRCNILKSDANVQGFRRMLVHFAKSIPAIRTYSHVHHLMRFGKLTIDATPVVFWFEKFLDADGKETS